MSLYDNPRPDGRDVVARIFVLESLVLVALGRQLVTLKDAKKGTLDKALAAIRDDAMDLVDDIKDTLLRDRAGPVIDEIMDKLRGNIETLSS